MCPPPAATAGTFPPRGCALFAKPEWPPSQLSGPRAQERRGGAGRAGARPRARGWQARAPRLRAVPPREGPRGLACSLSREPCPARGPRVSVALPSQPGAGTPFRKFAPRGATPPAPCPCRGARGWSAPRAGARTARRPRGQLVRPRGALAVGQTLRPLAGSPAACGIQVALDEEVSGGAAPQPQDTFPNIPVRPPVTQRALPLRLVGFLAVRVTFTRSAAGYLSHASRGCPVRLCGAGSVPACTPIPPCSSWKSAKSGARHRPLLGARLDPISECSGTSSQCLPGPWTLSYPWRDWGGGGRAASECAGVGLWSQPTCVYTHVLATRGCRRRHTAAWGHLDAAPWPEVPCAAVDRSPGSAAAAAARGEGRVLFCERAALALAWWPQSSRSPPLPRPRTSFVHS